VVVRGRHSDVFGVALFVGLPRRFAFPGRLGGAGDTVGRAVFYWWMVGVGSFSLEEKLVQTRSQSEQFSVIKKNETRLANSQPGFVDDIENLIFSA
jgi:hypothetical protein